MVCAWTQYAVPCEDAHNLYYMNKNFFVVSNDDVQKETTAGYGQPVVVTRPPLVPSAYQTRPPPAPSAYQTRPLPVPSPYPSQPQPVAAGAYPVATGGVSSAGTVAPPPPPAYPTPGIPQPPPPPPPPPAAYPTPARPQIRPQPKTPPSIAGYPSQQSESIVTLPDTTQPEPTTISN